MKSSIKSKKPKDKSGENVLHLAITKVVIIYFNFVNNDYSQDFRILYTFIHNKPFGQFLDISSKNCTFLKLQIQNLQKMLQCMFYQIKKILLNTVQTIKKT